MKSIEHRAREPGLSEEQLAFLARAGERLAGSLDLRTTLANLARLSVPTLCDYCVIDLLREDGHLHRVEAVHVDPAKEHLLTGHVSSLPAQRESGAWFVEIGPQVLAHGEPLLTPAGEAGPAARSHPFLPAAALGTLSSISAPLVTSGRTLGVLTLATADSGRRLGQADLAIVQDLARRASLAIDNARHFEATERARAAAELATSRLVALQRMTAALSDTMSRIRVAETIVDHVRDMLPSCKAIVATVAPDGEHLDLVRAVGHSRETLDRYDSTPLTFASPLTDAVRNQTPLFFDDYETYRACYPHLATSGPEGPVCVVAVPFVVEDRVIGGLSLRFQRSGQRASEDNAFVLHLARTCTQSLERAHLYEAERKARAEADVERRRLALLVEASAVLNASLDPAAIYDSLARVAVPSFASYCIVCNLDEDGTPHFVNALHEDPEKEKLLRDMRSTYPFGLNHPITEAARSGKAKLLRVVDDTSLRHLAADDVHLGMMRSIATTSSIVVPLIARGHTLGVLSFGATRGRYGQSDLALAEELGQRAALALDNARLFNEAQEASRVKDEFLGVVSHELRTPLNAILGWARMLRTGAVREGNQPRALESIERNAVHQAKLIDDLLDASRITAGKLRLDPSIVELAPVIESAVHAVTPGATNREITLHTLVDPASVPIFGDPSRLQQVVWNLLSNAIKFTPKGGRIDVRLGRAGDEAVLVVSDSGRGIRAELLPHIFERFRQGDGTLTRASGGLGLGLSIVRHLVEAHGGTVRAESDGPDTGARFTVKLPIAKPRALPAQGPPAKERRTEKRALAGLSVLVVDDEPDAREILSEILDLAGATVRTAADASEALSILSEFVPDVLVSDLAMPGDDGLSLIRKIRSRTPDRVATVPAIALTAYTRPEDRVRALNAGFQMHVPKPVDPTELVVTIASLRTLLP